MKHQILFQNMRRWQWKIQETLQTVMGTQYQEAQVRLCRFTHTSTFTSEINWEETQHKSTDVIKQNSKEDSASDWISRVIFNDDNLLAINKPSGHSVFGQHLTDTESAETVDLTKQSLMETLHQLSDHFNIPDLQVGISLKSYYSGLVLLTKNGKAVEKLRKDLSSAATQQRLLQTYLAITVGRPQCKLRQNNKIHLAREYLHNREMAVVCDRPIHSARKEGRMVEAVYNVRMISTNEKTKTSLVEVKINKDKWDAIPVLLSHYLSPVLGDNVYSSRTKYLMGVPIPSVPHAAFPDQQRLPDGTENALWNHFNLDRTPLPLFLHRCKLTLPNFGSPSSKPLEITAPPSTDFLNTLDCLGLHLDPST